MSRVLKCDGFLPHIIGSDGKHQSVTPEAGAEMKTWLDEHTPDGRKIDIVIEGSTPGEDLTAQQEAVGPFAEAGAAWWIEARWQGEGPDVLLERIQQGPPRITVS